LWFPNSNCSLGLCCGCLCPFHTLTFLGMKALVKLLWLELLTNNTFLVIFTNWSQSCYHPLTPSPHPPTSSQCCFRKNILQMTRPLHDFFLIVDTSACICGPLTHIHLVTFSFTLESTHPFTFWLNRGTSGTTISQWWVSHARVQQWHFLVVGWLHKASSLEDLHTQVRNNFGLTTRILL